MESLVFCPLCGGLNKEHDDRCWFWGFPKDPYMNKDVLPYYKILIKGITPSMEKLLLYRQVYKNYVVDERVSWFFNKSQEIYDKAVNPTSFVVVARPERHMVSVYNPDRQPYWVAKCLSGEVEALEVERHKTYNLDEFGILVEDNTYNLRLMKKVKIDSTYKASLFEKRWKHGYIWQLNFQLIFRIIQYILWLWGFGLLEMNEIIKLVNEGEN